MTPVEIALNLTKKGDGATQATKELNETSGAARKLEGSGVQTGKALNQLGESAEKGASAGRILSEVMRGNVLAIGQLGPVLKAAGAALLANPLFTLGALAATMVLPVIAKIAAGWKSQAEQAKAAGEASAAAASDALEAIGQRQDNETAAAFREIATAAAEARAQIEAVTLARVAQVDADEAVALAKINADPSLSPLQRAERSAEVRTGARERRAEIQVGAMGAQEAQSAAATAAAQAEAERKRGQEGSAESLLKSVAARSPAVIRQEKEEVDAAAKKRLPLLREASRSLLISDEKRDRYTNEIAETEQRQAELAQELAAAEAGHADYIIAAARRLREAREARVAAEEAAADAARKQAAERSINDARRAVIGITNQGAAQVSGIEIDAQRARAADEAKQQGAREIAEADYENMSARAGLNVGRGASGLGRDLAKSAFLNVAKGDETGERATARKAMEQLVSEAQSAARDGLTADEAGDLLPLVAQAIELIRSLGGDVRGLQAYGRQIRELGNKLQAAEREIQGLKARANTKG